MEQMVHKITLSSGKEVLMKEMKIKYQNLAIKAVGSRAGENQAMLGNIMQQELLKQLVVQINGKAVTGKELENLDDVFSYAEYGQLLQVLQKLMGGDSMGEFQTEIVSIGKE